MGINISKKVGSLFLVLVLLIFIMGAASAAITGITVTSPNGSEHWKGNQNITWTTSGGDGNVVILYTVNNWDTYDLVVGDYNGQLLSYDWNTVAFADGDSYKIRVRNVEDTSNDASNAVFSVDNTKPIVVSATASPNPAKDGTVTVTVVFNETMKTTVSPVVKLTDLNGDDYTLVEQSYSVSTWVGTTTIIDTNEIAVGNISVTTAQDLATNEMDANATAGTLTIDSFNPTLNTVAFNDVDGSTAISATDTLVLTFSEPMSTGTLTTGNATTLATELGLSAGEFGTTGFLAAWTESNTVLTITLGTGAVIASGATLNPTSAVTDVVGNSDATITKTITDNVNPLVRSATANPSVTKDANIIITVVFSEAMDVGTEPTVTITGLATDPYTATQSTYSGTTWVGWVVIADSNEDATGTISVSGAKDVTTSNTMDANATTGTVFVESINPTLNTVAFGDVDGSTAISATDTLTLTFSEIMLTSTLTTDSNETLATQLGLSAGGFGGSGFSAVWNDSNTVLTITLGTGAVIASGATLNPVVTVTDTNGNSDATITKTITDNVNPLVRSATANAAIVGAGVKTITIVFSEIMSTATSPTVTVTGLATSPYTVTQSDYNGTAATWTGTFTILDNDELATATINISGAKDVTTNNTMDANNSATFTVDTIAPVVSNIDFNKSSYRMTQDASAKATIVEDNTANTVTVNGSSATETGTAGTWTYTFLHGKTEVGRYSVSVIATDAVGNSAQYLGYYDVVTNDPATDTTPPTITANAIPVQTITQTSAGVVFQSSEDGNAKVHYGTTTNYSLVTTYSSVTANEDKTITLSDLVCGTTYHYAMYARDGNGNERSTSDENFTTSACDVDAAPTVRIDSNVVGSDYVIVQAYFNDDSNDLLSIWYEYSEQDADEGSFSSTATIDSDQNVSWWIDLDENTSYTFSVFARDSSGNVAQDDINFTTTIGTDYNYQQNLNQYWDALWLPPTLAEINDNNTTVAGVLGYTVGDHGYDNHWASGAGDNWTTMYHYDGSNWLVQYSATGIGTLTDMNVAIQNPFWIYMTVADTFQLD